MKFTLLPTVSVLLAATVLSGCASVTRGSTNEVTFSSAPSGAKVTTSAGQSCTTPCKMIFKRREAFVATFTDASGDVRTIDVITDVAANGVGATAGNILAGGPIGVGIDIATGAALDHFPDPVHADFSKPQEEQIQGTKSGVI